MTGGGFGDVTIYAAAAALVLGLALIAVHLLRNTSERDRAGWRYTAQYDQLHKLMQAERYDEAARLVAPLLRKRDITESFFELAGQIASRQGKPAEAIGHRRAAARRFPGDAPCQIRLVRVLIERGGYAEAHRVLQRARKRVRAPEQLDTPRAELAQAEQRWDDAIRLWALVRARNPREINGYLRGRACLLAAGRDDEAAELLADAALRMPNHPAVRQALAATGQPDPAPR